MTPTRFIRKIFENMGTAVLLLGPDLRLQCINPAGEILLEVSGRQVLGRQVQELIPGTGLEAVNLQTALERHKSLSNRGLSLGLASGKRVTVDLTVTPLADGEHPPQLVLEMQQMDRHLRIAREENLLAQHQATRGLLRGLAHEIKNPLGGLRGAAQLLERALPDPALREYTQVIVREADRLQTLVDRLLGPNTLLRKRRTNIHEVLERVRSLIVAETSRDIRVVCDYDPSLPELSADPDQLIQAVLNVVRNAVQALGGKGTVVFRTRVERRLTIGQHCHRLAARVDIIDDGPGVAPELMEGLFYPMVSGRPNGTGLGLSITQAIMHRHGGLVECESRAGRTVFSLLLPLETPGGA